MQTNRVFINHFDCICSGAKNAFLLFENICSGKSGIKSNSEFFEEKSLGLGVVDEVDIREYLLVQVENILASCNLQDFSSTLLLVGSSVGGMRLSEDTLLKDGHFKNLDYKKHGINVISDEITKKYKFKDAISFSTACTSSANALGFGYEVISKGIYENVLVVGFDTLCKTTVGGFNSLGVLSQNPCRPFDTKRDGMNVAEASALLLLQSVFVEESIEFLGVGYSSDAHHITQPSPDGSGALSAMQNALKSKGLKPQDIDYINAHGTGTLANDKSEMTAIKSLFASKVYVSSTKSITGHTLGAAGVLEAILTAMCLQKQTVLPNNFLETPEIEGLNLPLKSKKENLKYALSNSFAFGGNNVSLLLGVVE